MKKQETKKRMFRGGFADCLGYGTRQRGFLKKNLCRMLHSAKKFKKMTP
jgi:hypothetical protein